MGNKQRCVRSFGCVFVNALIKTEGRESLKTITLSRTKGPDKDCAANTYSNCRTTDHKYLILYKLKILFYT